jgi:hypothetical protein
MESIWLCAEKHQFVSTSVNLLSDDEQTFDDLGDRPQRVKTLPSMSDIIEACFRRR